MKILTVYFSAESGTTKALAQRIAQISGSDLFEIMPEKPYTSSDLNYMNPLSRCNREKFGKKNVAIKGKINDFASYDLVLIGFPIWYGGGPAAVNSFCQMYDWSGKKAALFATSGGSPIGKSGEKILPYIKGAKLIDASLFSDASDEELKNWISRATE